MCMFGYCIYIILGTVNILKSKEINISPVLTHYTTHESIVADALRDLLTVPSTGLTSDDHLCNAALMNAHFPPPLFCVFPTFVSGHWDI